MTTDRTLERLRAANPARAVAIDSRALFERIIASQGDPRLTQVRRQWFAFRSHPLALFAACLALAACGTAGAAKLGLIPDFGVFAHDTPAQLFRANPSGIGPGAHRQVVNLRTVHQVASATVPGLGTYAYWIGLSKKGWLCSAIRLPDGTWADTSVKPSKFQVSGPVPGLRMVVARPRVCVPPILRAVTRRALVAADLGVRAEHRASGGGPRQLQRRYGADRRWPVLRHRAAPVR